jgi:hypothetical protein
MIRKDSEKGEYRGVRATLGRTGISLSAESDLDSVQYLQTFEKV